MAVGGFGSPPPARWKARLQLGDSPELRLPFVTSPAESCASAMSTNPAEWGLPSTHFKRDSTLLGHDPPPVRATAFVFLAVFQAYSLMQNMQFSLKHEMGVAQGGHLGPVFTNAVTMLHVGKFVSRLAHTALGCLSPLARVYFAIICALIGTLVPPLFILANGSHDIFWVSVSYGFTGVGIGVFEATFLAVITPLGRRTKAWAILGIPAAFFTIGVPGCLFLGYGVPSSVLYWYTAGCLVVSLFVVRRLNLSEDGVHTGRGEFHAQPSVLASVKAWRLWLPPLLPHVTAKILVNFGMENLYPTIGVTYNADMVPLLGPERNSILMAKDSFQALENLVCCMADTGSRFLLYAMPRSLTAGADMPMFYVTVLFTFAAFYLLKTATAWVALVSLLLTFSANGLVYAVGARHIDQRVPRVHSLVAYSFWCFTGDIASVVGAKAQDSMRDWICGNATYTYECLST